VTPDLGHKSLYCCYVDTSSIDHWQLDIVLSYNFTSLWVYGSLIHWHIQGLWHDPIYGHEESLIFETVKDTTTNIVTIEYMLCTL